MPTRYGTYTYLVLPPGYEEFNRITISASEQYMSFVPGTGDRERVVRVSINQKYNWEYHHATLSYAR